MIRSKPFRQRCKICICYKTTRGIDFPGERNDAFLRTEIFATAIGIVTVERQIMHLRRNAPCKLIPDVAFWDSIISGTRKPKTAI